MEDDEVIHSSQFARSQYSTSMDGQFRVCWTTPSDGNTGRREADGRMEACSLIWRNARIVVRYTDLESRTVLCQESAVRGQESVGPRHYLEVSQSCWSDGKLQGGRHEDGINPSRCVRSTADRRESLLGCIHMRASEGMQWYGRVR